MTAIKRTILIEDRITSLTKPSQELMDGCKDLDRRLVRIEAKFELLERMASPGRARECVLLARLHRKQSQTE